MNKENILNPEQTKELVDWLKSEIQKLSKDINRHNAIGNYSRAERGEGARDAYYKVLNEITRQDE